MLKNSWYPDTTPKDKLLKLGASSLTEDELVGILIGSGKDKLSAVGVGRSILDYVGNNLSLLSRMNVVELQQIEGIGSAKASVIVASLELGRRRVSYECQKRARILCTADVVEILKPLIIDLPYEEVWALFVSNSKKILDKFRLSTGGTESSSFDVKVIFSRALSCGASGIILVHNHPSGSASPSKHDIECTKVVERAARTLEMQLLDHIIIAEDNIFSFAQEKLL